jgi:hypothetical protein
VSQPKFELHASQIQVRSITVELTFSVIELRDFINIGQLVQKSKGSVDARAHARAHARTHTNQHDNLTHLPFFFKETGLKMLCI